MSDIDFGKLLDCHQQASKALTISAVRPAGRFGELRVANDGEVTRFTEKPANEQGYINGGFMAVDRAKLSAYLTDDPALVFETGVMPRVQQDGGLHAYQHEGFWQCMDHIREYALLNDMWAKGDAPWAEVWK